MCAAGQVILSQGSYDASLYIVMHGEVELLGVSQDSDDALQYALLHADDTAASAYFGEQVQIDHSMRWLYHLTRFRL
jgi:CRP-like cAMP-binding protein